MRKHGFEDFHAFVKRTQDEPEWFWDEAVKDLGIDFFQPYDKVLDASEGPQWPRWFVGGTVNLTYNTVDRHAANGEAGEPFGDHVGGRGGSDAHAHVRGARRPRSTGSRTA